MFNMEELPPEIQLMIWQKAFDKVQRSSMFHLAKICNTVLEYGMGWKKGNDRKDTSKICKCIFIRYNIRVLIAESEKRRWDASDVDRHTSRSKSRHQLDMQRDWHCRSASRVWISELSNSIL